MNRECTSKKTQTEKNGFVKTQTGKSIHVSLILNVELGFLHLKKNQINAQRNHVQKVLWWLVWLR